MRRIGSRLFPLLLSACFLRAEPPPEAVAPDEATRALEIQSRLDSFYGRLSRVPLDAFPTYNESEVRAYFTGAAAFSDYYASLANLVREAGLRNSTAESIQVRQFRFDDADTAVVSVVILGRHQRRLRFWQIELQRIDTWRQLNGIWILVPDKL